MQGLQLRQWSSHESSPVKENEVNVTCKKFPSYDLSLPTCRDVMNNGSVENKLSVYLVSLIQALIILFTIWCNILLLEFVYVVFALHYVNLQHSTV